MATWGQTSQLPRKFENLQVLVAFSGLTAVPNAGTSTVDVERISLTNTTASTITFILADGSGSPIPLGNLDEVQIDPGSPASFEFHSPIRATGLQWLASATGLYANITGWRTTGWTLDTGYVRDTEVA